MSKERESALRTGNTPPVQPTAADVQTMAEMHANRTPDPVMDNADMEGTGLRWSNAPAAVPGAAEDVALAMRDTAPLVTDALSDNTRNIPTQVHGKEPKEASWICSRRYCG